MKIPFQKVNLDSALRYQPIVKFIKKLKLKNATILEVGSGTNGISDFYSGQVLGVDNDFSRTPAEKNPNIEHQKGSIDHLPFKKNSFPVVVCVDTFEHLPRSLRDKAVDELVRVTKKNGWLFIGFPSGKGAQRFEKILSNKYQKKYAQEHPWLAEHEKFTLPEVSEIVAALVKTGIKRRDIRIIKNVNIYMWFIIHLFFTVHPGNKLTKLLELFKFVIYQLAKVKIPPYYRTIIIAQK